MHILHTESALGGLTGSALFLGGARASSICWSSCEGAFIDRCVMLCGVEYCSISVLLPATSLYCTCMWISSTWRQSHEQDVDVNMPMHHVPASSHIVSMTVDHQLANNITSKIRGATFISIYWLPKHNRNSLHIPQSGTQNRQLYLHSPRRPQELI